MLARTRQFQSTPSSQKVTNRGLDFAKLLIISIHTFLAEGDRFLQFKNYDTKNFNPHTFLAEGDRREERLCTTAHISIHTFLAEGDRFSVRG